MSNYGAPYVGWVWLLVLLSHLYCVNGTIFGTWFGDRVVGDKLSLSVYFELK